MVVRLFLRAALSDCTGSSFSWLHELPEVVRAAFAINPFQELRATARMLKMHPKTLRRHCDARNITWRQKGLGGKRPHRVFTLVDV
jgi:hypothetical protein